MKIKKFLYEFPFHPFLFTIYAILFPLSNNLEELSPAVALRSILIGLLVTLLIWLAAWLIFRDWYQGAFLTTWSLFLFFSYGHIFELLKGSQWAGLPVIRHRYFLLLWIVLFVAAFLLISRMRGQVIRMVQVLNVAMLVLVVLVTYQIGSYSYVQYQRSVNQSQATLKDLKLRGIQSIAGELKPPAKADLPDIYYISLESYSRQDALLSEYNYDNSPFQNFLKNKGFIIQDCARSNFPKTALSLSSTLNLNYLQTFSQDLFKKNKSYNDTFNKFIEYSTVRQTLEDLGYKIISFKTGWNMIELPDADVFYDVPAQNKEENLFYPGINAFENMLIDTTMLSAFPTQLDAINARLASNMWTRKYAVTNVQIDGLMQTADLPGPKFVLAHLIAMHSPFVVDPQGEFNIYDENTHAGIDAGYIAALEFTNRRLETIVDEILARPGPKPIIILLGDHGSKETRLQVMNALYLPGNGVTGFYPTISSVNIFRLIFDRYFGANFDVLPDVSYALGNQLYNFKVSPETNSDCK